MLEKKTPTILNSRTDAVFASVKIGSIHRSEKDEKVKVGKMKK